MTYLIVQPNISTYLKKYYTVKISQSNKKARYY